MKNNKFEKLYDILKSQIDYCNLIESYGEDFIDMGDVDFNLLQTQFCSVYLTLMLDEYLIKIDDKNYTTPFVPKFIKQFVDIIATDNGKGYTIGELSYRDEVTLLVKIRHKLAHGDYYLENDDIVFEESKKEGRINLQKLISALTSFDISYENYFLEGPRCKVFNSNMDESKYKIEKESDFDLLCDKLYRIEIIDTPLPGNKRTEQYLLLMEQLHKTVYKNIEFRREDAIPQIINNYKRVFDLYGMDIKFSMKRLTTTDCYKALKNKFMANFDLYKGLSPINQKNLINNFSYRLNMGKYQKFNTRKGIVINLLIIEQLKKNPDFTLRKLITENPFIEKYLLEHIDDVIMSSYIVAFSSLYMYGLEKNATKSGINNFIEITEGKQVDFTKFDLEKLYDKNMKIEHNCDNFEEDILNYEKKSMVKVDNLISSSELKLKSYIDNCKNKTKSKEQELRKKIEEAKELKHQLTQKINITKAKLQNYNKEKYIKNINIIYHIRNAIAHGNIFLDSYSNEVENTGLIIKDIHEGKVTYEMKIKMKDFTSLFLLENIETLYNFVTNNIENKEKIDDYMDTLNIRFLFREAREKIK